MTGGNELAVGSKKEPDNANLTVIFKGLNKCNAGCTFCCVGTPEGKIISWDDFIQVADSLEDYIREKRIAHMTYTFHGGEPTLLGAELLNKMCERVNQMPVKVWFNMQSNMLSIPHDIREIISKHQIKVGTSVDPLDLGRLDKAGKSVFSRWLTNCLDFLQNGQPPGAIYVVTKSSLGHAQRVYDICEAIGSLVGQRFALQINPVYAQGKASENQEEVGITADEFGSFLIDMWRIWEENRRSISLAPIQSFAGYFRTPDKNRMPHLSCTFLGDCKGSHVGIDYDLNVAGCGRRLDSQAFLGNLNTDSLAAILDNNHESILISGRSDRLRDGACRDCDFFHLCHGGCPDDAWLESKDLRAPHHWCSSYRQMFEAMAEEIPNYRKPATPPPFRTKNESEKLEVLAIDKPAHIPEKSDKRPREVWVLPDSEGKWLGFDSEFPMPKERKNYDRMRLWCYNRQVNSLVMWEDLLQSRGIAIVLFEAEGLEEAMNILNSLRAFIILDVFSILKEKNGAHILNKCIERFTGDPLWFSQVLPFSQMITKRVKRESFAFKNCFGLTPDQFVVKYENQDQNDNMDCRDIISRLEQEADTNLAEWVLGRRPCLNCSYFRTCGARFALGDGEPCANEMISIVAHVHNTAKKLENILENQ